MRTARPCTERWLGTRNQAQQTRLTAGVRRADDVLIAMVESVDKREDRLVHQSAVARVSEQVTVMARMMAEA